MPRKATDKQRHHPTTENGKERQKNGSKRQGRAKATTEKQATAITHPKQAHHSHHDSQTAHSTQQPTQPHTVATSGQHSTAKEKQSGQPHNTATAYNGGRLNNRKNHQTHAKQTLLIGIYIFII